METIKAHNDRLTGRIEMSAESLAIKYAREVGELTGLLRILLYYKDVETIHKIIRKKIEEMEE